MIRQIRKRMKNLVPGTNVMRTDGPVKAVSLNSVLIIGDPTPLFDQLRVLLLHKVEFGVKTVIPPRPARDRVDQQYDRPASKRNCDPDKNLARQALYSPNLALTSR